MKPRDQLITLRLTTDELEAIEQKALAEGRDRSGLLRWIINQYLRTEQENQ